MAQKEKGEAGGGYGDTQAADAEAINQAFQAITAFIELDLTGLDVESLAKKMSGLKPAVRTILEKYGTKYSEPYISEYYLLAGKPVMAGDVECCLWVIVKHRIEEVTFKFANNDGSNSTYVDFATMPSDEELRIPGQGGGKYHASRERPDKTVVVHFMAESPVEYAKILQELLTRFCDEVAKKGS